MKLKRRRRTMFPKPLDECLAPVTRPAFAKLGAAGSRIITDWNKIVGSQLAGYTAPLKLSFPTGKTTDGTLTLAVQNGFALELQHMQPVILEKLAVYFGYQAIGKIKISHTYQAAKSAAPKKAADSKTVTISPAILEEVKDAELKSVLHAFANTLSTKEK